MSTSDINLSICYGCMKKLQEGQHICPFCGYNSFDSQNPERTLPEGTVLSGKYLVGKMLGGNDFSITYLGYDLKLELKVAIREYFQMRVCFRNAHTYDVQTETSEENNTIYSKGMDVFLDEARAQAKFNSPYIVHVRDFFREHRTAYIVMDYVEGTRLKAAINNVSGRIKVDRVVTLFKPLIRTLGRVHEQNLIHRDINPDNLLLVRDRDGEHLVLLDFSIAQIYICPNDHTVGLIRTFPFHPLEQYSREGRQGPYTDVYALCATMYYAITGVVPPLAIERNIDETLLEPISAYGVPIAKSAEAAILHGMALKSSDRTQTMEQLLGELQENGEADPGRQDVGREKEQRGTQEQKRQQANQAAEEQRQKEELKNRSTIIKIICFIAGVVIAFLGFSGKIPMSAAATTAACIGIVVSRLNRAERENEDRGKTE